MGDKKRKRANSEKEEPRKRIEVDAPRAVVKVKIVEDQDDFGPLIASTAGCFPPQNIAFQAYKRPLENDSGLEILLHSSSHPALDYTARQEQSGSADSLLKHYIGIFDPKISQLTVTEVPRVVLRARLRPSQKELKEVEQQQNEKRSIRDARQALGMEFGTKKMKKALLDLTENAISPQKTTTDGAPPITPVKNALTSAILDSMNVSATSMPTREERQAAVDEAKPRPKPNTAAEQPQDVYPLESLIPEELSRHLDVKAWIDTADRNEAIKTHSRYVSNRVHVIALKKDIKQLKALRYILALITFKLACTPSRAGGLRLPKERDDLKNRVDASSSVLDFIRRQFSERGELTKWHTDLLHTHICALALHIDAFATDTHDLREDLRLDAPQMHAYFREIGARVAPPSDRERERLRITQAEAGLHRFARLKLPLEFPREKSGVRAKRKR